ncbi:hypothetical protein M3Y95_00991500 [Aphelenchoides besseyi]|nr:hypothetical protein M3Y95_00991500 [Aphelenchoides besseyi]
MDSSDTDDSISIQLVDTSTRRPKYWILFGLLMVLLVFLTLNYDGETHRSFTLVLIENTTTETYRPLTESPEKHIYMDLANQCGGVSNMIFRIVSLYGIGRRLNRAPCLEGKCVVNYQTELFAAFPNLQLIELKERCSYHSKVAVKFAVKSSRLFEDPETLLQYENETTIRLSISYLQNFLYFKDVHGEVRNLLKFSVELNKIVDEYVNDQLFKTDEDRKSTKVCVHMRGTDFGTIKSTFTRLISSSFYLSDHPLLPSSLEFTLPAIQFLVQKAAEDANSTNLSIVLFSEDIKFVKNITSQLKTSNLKLFYPETLQRLGYMNMISRYCDYLLLTASGSTFGWWSAYFLPDFKQSNVFYNSLIFKPHRPDAAEVFVEANFFPSKWNRLSLVDGNESEIEWQNRTLPGRHI